MIDVSKLLRLSQLSQRSAPCTEALDAISGQPRPAAAVSFAPPPPRHVEARNLDLVAASLAGGLVAASGKAVTAEEAVGVWREVRAAVESGWGIGP